MQLLVADEEMERTDLGHGAHRTNQGKRFVLIGRARAKTFQTPNLPQSSAIRRTHGRASTNGARRNLRPKPRLLLG